MQAWTTASAARTTDYHRSMVRRKSLACTRLESERKRPGGFVTASGSVPRVATTSVSRAASRIVVAVAGNRMRQVAEAVPIARPGGFVATCVQRTGIR